jgi:signal transduction histidine kinase
LSFISPDQLRFKYRLDGLDRDWIDAGLRRTAYYSHVAPGKYFFNVIAANRDGVWSVAGNSLQVIVLPAFYQTWWFSTIAWTLALVIGALVWRYRIVQLKRAHAAQQEIARQLIVLQENERKRIAAELHDSLGQHLVIIKNLALISLNKHAEATFRHEAEEISAEASQALSEVKEISYNLRPYQLDRLGLTKAIEGFMQKVANACSIAFISDVDNIDNLFPKEEEINLYRIVQESVSNIVKHSQATQARVAVQRDASRVLLTISDNGRGFVPGMHAGPGSGGFGLIGMSERVQLLGGTSRINSVPGHGTTITIEIGLRKKTL